MSKSIFCLLLASLLMFQSQSIGAASILGSGENVVNESDNLNELINPVLDVPRDINTNVKRHVDKTSSCSGISLDFSNMNIGSTVRNYFINGSYVQNLSLAHNKIEEFDNGAFGGISNLKLLDLSYNKLSPTKMLSFGGHATLETLILDYNKADDPVQQSEYDYDNWGNYRQRTTTASPPISIPISDIYPKLKNLSLRGTNIIPSFDNWEQYFPSLEKLDLSEINLENVDNSYFDSFPSSIKILNLQSTKVNKLSIDKLLNIEELDVNSNFFGTDRLLPHLPNIKKLNLFNNQIVDLPYSLASNFPNLEELNIGGNRIESIWSFQFYNLTKLKVLNLSKNPLESTNFVRGLSQLNTLILDDMQNSKVIESLGTLGSLTYELNIKYLSLKNNNLTNLPENFINSMKFLEEIDLSGNNLSSLPRFSTTLKTLNLRNNHIEYLDDDLLRSLSNLKQIQLGNNPLKQLEIELISNLPKSCILNWE